MRFVAVAAGLLMLATASQAKNKKTKTAPKDPQDEIEVAGHVPLTSGPVHRFISTQHYSSYYLYAERDGGKSVTLIDVTNFARPVVLADVAYPSNVESTSLFAVAGTAAMVAGEAGGGAPTPAAPQTIRIMDFADLQHPKVAHEFTGVTAISRDDRRGLIFVANGEGVWILHQVLAEDPEVEKAYANHVLYDH